MAQVRGLGGLLGLSQLHLQPVPIGNLHRQPADRVRLAQTVDHRKPGREEHPLFRAQLQAILELNRSRSHRSTILVTKPIRHLSGPDLLILATHNPINRKTRRIDKPGIHQEISTLKILHEHRRRHVVENQPKPFLGLDR